MIPIFVLVVFGIAATGAVYLIQLKLTQQASKSVGAERDIIRDEISKYDEAIAKALAQMKEMVPLDEIHRLEEEKNKVLQKLAQERERVKKVEGDLEVQQERVDKQEAKHRELKKGKEEADKFAEELRKSKDKTSVDSKNMASSLKTKEAALTAKVVAMTGTADGNDTTKQLVTTLQQLSQQLNDLSEIHLRGATRFVNLEKQYAELEKEFRKLIDREIEGDPDAEPEKEDAPS